MSVSASDIKFKKSVIVTDTSANGGRKSTVEVQSGVRHNLFPRVTKGERENGVTRYRKEFWANENADDDIAYGTLIFLGQPSNAGDRFYLGEGEQADTQGDLEDYDPLWMGVGQLNAVLSGGETSVQLAMENNDFQFPNDGYLHLTDMFSTGQTIDSGVNIGDSVEYSGGTWSAISPTTEIVYPKGRYIRSNTVKTIQATTKEEWLAISENKYTDEDIGDGDGADTSPALTTLVHNTNGICRQPGKLPVVTATCGATGRTVNVAADGTCSGYCSAGELNMVTGVWTTDITWSTAPDNATDILCTYYENAFSYSGNVATVSLAEQVANAYGTTNSYGAGCIDAGDVEPSSEDWAETTTSGTYDETTYPLILFNDGTDEDSWTITFTSATAFTCSGANAGSVGTGGITADFSPTNPDTGQPYFTLDKDGWGGTWANGETVTFKTHPAAVPIWMKEVVPASTTQEPYNLVDVDWYCE